MDAQQQVVEGQSSFHRHDDLAVDDELVRLDRAKRLDQLGEVARQRLPRLRLQLHVVAVAKDHGAETVPLRLELPPVTGRDAVDALRLHRRKGRLQRQRHFAFFVPASNTLRKLKRFFPAITGFHRSPSFLSRGRTLSMRKSSMRTPRSTSSHVTGTETLATGVGR